MSTKEQLSKERPDYMRTSLNFSSERPPAGVSLNLKDQIMPRSSTFLKLDNNLTSGCPGNNMPLRHSAVTKSDRFSVNIKPYSYHSTQNAYE